MAAFTKDVDSTDELTRLTLAPSSDNVSKVNSTAKPLSILGVHVARDYPWTVQELEATFGNSTQPVWIHRYRMQKLALCSTSNTGELDHCGLSNIQILLSARTVVQP